MPTWTHQQLAAITADNHTILVSAAAGSGKTAVLVERIIRLIKEGYQLDRMLIVTFTKAAASEMRQRLNRRLLLEAHAANENINRALDVLESTEISTIHAFCQKVLRNNFQAVGIDPMVRACDDQQKKALFAESWLQAFNELLEARDDADFVELAYAWDQESLQEVTDKLYDFLMSLPEPFAWLDEKVAQAAQKPYADHPWYKMLVQLAGIELEGIGSILMNMERLMTEPNAVAERLETLRADEAAYDRLMAADLTDPQAMLTALDGFELKRMSTVRGLDADQKEWQERFKKQREKIGGIIKQTKENLAIDEGRFDVELSMMQRHLRGLSALTKRVHAIYLGKKAEQHVIDFSDMEQFTLQVLRDEALCRQIRGEYDHIFVDECQDVSQVQDAILQSIHHEGNFMFMVGDVKQSIYRFRKADPTLFMHRLRTFPPDEDARERRIILQKNFRSRNSVLEATNEIFRTVMRPNVTELTYEGEDELVCGRETTDDPPVELHLIDIQPGEDGENTDALEAEASIVIKRVQELLETPFDDGKQVRNYTYRDMVILLSAAATTAPRLVEMLGKAGIPVFYDGAAAFFELQEVQQVKALLSVIDNPKQDIPLLSALKMPPFALSDVQLGAIRTAKTGKDVPFYEAFDSICEAEGDLADRCRAIREQLATWRFEAETMRLSDFVWHVMQHSGYYAAVGALPKGALRQANLRMLFQRAQDYENSIGGTLADFLLLTDRQKAADDSTSAKMLGENENLLRIMTMHKSKGLEFPVVFCMQMSGKLHKPYRSDLLMHTRLGVALPYINREMRIKRKTMANEAFRVQRELDDKAERARLLYVAMTRARERLILVGCCKGSERDTWSMPEGDFAVWTARSMTDWLMQGVNAALIHNLSTNSQQRANLWNIRFWSEIEIPDVDKDVDNFDLQNYLTSVLSAPRTQACPTWEETNRTDAPPLKTSVTAIAKKAVLNDPLPLTDAEEDADTKRIQEEIVSPLRMSDLPSRPAFLEEKQMTGAERGTLTHRALSLIPIGSMRRPGPDAVKVAVHDMAERGVFTYQDVLALDMWGIAAYFGSELGQRMMASPNVRREWPFNLVMDDASGTLLQGVIDCAFIEDGEWVLVDYKTDRISDEAAFIDRYRLQLTWYARALEKITQRRVKEMWLYAISKRKAYPVEPDDL